MERYCQCFFAELGTAYELSIYAAEAGAGTRILFIGEHTEIMPQAFGKLVFGFLEKTLDILCFMKKRWRKAKLFIC